MPITYDITKDLRFMEGKIEGKIEGKMEGKMESTRITVINMLKDKSLTINTIARFVDMPIDFVKKIQEELNKNPNLKA